ncbi:Glycosyltransferase DXD sugar-binding motif [Trinorchestia longiramus]|nr:Glycosyltransferase DXD sugar-binding motif [Trinorchestia longiramus]
MMLLISVFQPRETFKPYPLEKEASEEDFFTLHPYSESCVLDPPNDPVFHFLEGYGHTTLTSRMWCTVEAACVANPNSSVVVHMKASTLLWTAQAATLLQEYDNLRVVTLEEQALFRQSPLRSWYEHKKWQESAWAVSHFNDAVRWLILYHYGGVYMDLDSISVRPLTPPAFTALNFAGMESNQWVGAGVIGLNTTHHWLPSSVLQHLAHNLDTSEWGAMGPKLLTRVVSERCGIEMPDVASSRCENFTVLPIDAFYIVPWWRYQLFVNPDKQYSLSRRLLSDSQVLVVHTWNHLTKNMAVPLSKPPSVVYRGDPETNKIIRRTKPDVRNTLTTNNEESYFSPIAVIARKVCPKIVASAGEFL